MKISIKLSREELGEIIGDKCNYCSNENDLKINVIDAIDGTLSLPAYDVDVEVEGE